MAPELYSPALRVRYRATLALRNERPLRKRWPAGCGGAANAFLVLLGPSMGGAPPGQVSQRGGANRPFRASPMKIGPNAMNFDWGDHRKARWIRLCAAMLGGEDYVPSLTALLNLDWRHSTSEKSIPQQDLLDGFQNFVWPLLRNLRPRLICALTNRVWDTVQATIAPFRIPFSRCPVPLSREPIILRLPSCQYSTFFLKAHNHPSRFLSNAQILDLGKASEWFLGRSRR